MSLFPNIEMLRLQSALQALAAIASLARSRRVKWWDKAENNLVTSAAWINWLSGRSGILDWGTHPLVGSPFTVEFDSDGRAVSSAERRFIVDCNEVTLELADASDRFQLIGSRNIVHLGAPKLKADILATDSTAFLISADKAAWGTLRHGLNLPDDVRNDGEANWAVGVNFTGFQKGKRKEAIEGYKAAND